MPTSVTPLCCAARACARANARPFAAGSDCRTTVHPLSPVGHGFSAWLVGTGCFFGFLPGFVAAGVVPVVASGGAIVGVTVSAGLVRVTYGAPLVSWETNAAAPMPASA